MRCHGIYGFDFSPDVCSGTDFAPSASRGTPVRRRSCHNVSRSSFTAPAAEYVVRSAGHSPSTVTNASVGSGIDPAVTGPPWGTRTRPPRRAVPRRTRVAGPRQRRPRHGRGSGGKPRHPFDPAGGFLRGHSSALAPIAIYIYIQYVVIVCNRTLTSSRDGTTGTATAPGHRRSTSGSTRTTCRCSSPTVSPPTRRPRRHTG